MTKAKLLGFGVMEKRSNAKNAHPEGEWTYQVEKTAISLIPTVEHMEFTTLALRDVILQTVAVHWPSATCRILFEPVGVGEVKELAFAGVTELIVPRQQPWGPSSFVNKVLQPEPGCFQLAMQSGDVIQVRASTWHYQRKAREVQ